jgi:two-component system response regulator TctD
MRVLLVEDNRPLAASLLAALKQQGMHPDCVHDGLHADQVLRAQAYEVVVLDLSLPRLDGLEVLRRLRARGGQVPVLVLTARGDTGDRVQGLNAGADDYLAKPFDLAELEARIRALARRAQGRGSTVVRCGPICWDSVGRNFTLRDQAFPLPPREHGILELLVGRFGKPVSKESMADRLTSLDESLSPEAIEIYVSRLRRKLEGSGLSIRTLRGLGYLLEIVDGEPAA